MGIVKARVKSFLKEGSSEDIPEKFGAWVGLDFALRRCASVSHSFSSLHLIYACFSYNVIPYYIIIIIIIIGKPSSHCLHMRKSVLLIHNGSFTKLFLHWEPGQV